MKSNRQKGSAHVVVIICLVAVIIFALGLIFWQNFILDSSKTTSQTTSSSKTPAKTDATVEKTITTKKYGTDLSLTYPSTWAASRTSNNSAGNDEIITLTGPTKEVAIVLFQTSPGQYGGACGDDAPLITHISQTAIPSAPSLTYIEAVAKGTDGLFYKWTNVNTKTTATESLKVNGSSCGIGLGVFQTARSDVWASLTIKLAPIHYTNTTSTDSNAFMKAITGEEYKQAVKIVQSFVFKK